MSTRHGGKPASERFEAPRHDHLDRDFIEGLWEDASDLRIVLFDVDADALLAVFLTDSDAYDSAHLHETRFVTPFHIRYGDHG